MTLFIFVSFLGSDVDEKNLSVDGKSTSQEITRYFYSKSDNYNLKLQKLELKKRNNPQVNMNVHLTCVGKYESIIKYLDEVIEEKDFVLGKTVIFKKSANSNDNQITADLMLERLIRSGQSLLNSKQSNGNSEDE